MTIFSLATPLYHAGGGRGGKKESGPETKSTISTDLSIPIRLQHAHGSNFVMQADQNLCIVYTISLAK